jgi:hypothetical protein
LLAYQKEIIEKEVPFLYDKELLRVDARKIKNILLPFPTDSLNGIFKDLPVYM